MSTFFESSITSCSDCVSIGGLSCIGSGCNITSDLRLIGSKQDYIKTTKGLVDPVSGELFDLIELYDGHGPDLCINALRYHINTTEIIRTSLLPEVSIQLKLSIDYPLMPWDSGSTFVCAKIFANRIECRSVGDSEIWIYKNDERVYNSPVHNWHNLEEQSRIRDVGIKAKPRSDYVPVLLSPTKIRMDPSFRVQWISFATRSATISGETIVASATTAKPSNPPDRLVFVPTQSLGHRGITGLQAAIQTIWFEPSDAVKVIVGSDGLWDMIMADCDKEILCSGSATDLAELAEKRWRQEWDFVEDPDEPDRTIKNTFDSFDDISVGIINH
jgi:hypothetical protein